MVNAAEAYRRQQIMTATPEALTLMLYNGCLKFINEGTEALERKDYEQANISLQKAQNIISEFRITLSIQRHQTGKEAPDGSRRRGLCRLSRKHRQRRIGNSTGC